jgi:prepilin-type N-terminal cleavage/methylation domain-containing protein
VVCSNFPDRYRAGKEVPRVTSRRKNPSSGFSLVELMVVIAIIVIVSAASIPMGLNFARVYKITGAAQGLAAEIQRARAQAVKRNTSRGILLNFNYPQLGQYQFTSLDPSPLTGDWDGGIYPANPGVFDNTMVDYGSVPVPPNNLENPNLAQGVQSPHGTPVQLPTDVGFVPGQRNALLFRSDGSVFAVNAAGPVGPAAISRDANGVDWLVTVVDSTTNLTRVIRVSPGGKVKVDDL